MTTVYLIVKGNAAPQSQLPGALICLPSIWNGNDMGFIQEIKKIHVKINSLEEKSNEVMSYADELR